MRLEYENLTVRSVEDADVPFYVMWWNNGEVMAHSGFPLGLNTTLQKVAEQLSKDDEAVSMHLIAEIGVKICLSEYQNRGYGKKLLSMLISELFKRGAEKIVLGTNYKNRRARQVYSRIGFEETEIRRDGWIDQLGDLQTTVFCELLPENFVSFIN